MKTKQLLILVVLALILGGLAVLTSRRRETAAPSVIGQEVLPDLDVNAVRKIVVTAGTNSATIVKRGGAWTAAEAFGYPADFEKIRERLIDLADLRIGQVIAAAGEQRRALNLLPPSAEAGGGTRVALYDDPEAAEPVAALLVGATRRRAPADGGAYGGYPDGQYVSPDGGDTVYLVADTLNTFAPEAASWLDTEIVNVAAADVTNVTIRHPDSQPVRLARGADGGDLAVQGLAEDEETDTSKVYGVASALSYLRFDDIADPALPDDALGLDNPAVFTAQTRKGETYTIRLGAAPEGHDGRYARLSAALLPQAEPAGTSPAEASTEAAAGPEAENPESGADAQAQKERAEQEEKIAVLNRRLEGWTYRIPSHKAKAMLYSRDDIVTAKEQEDEKPPTAATDETE
ncbi:MAG: DUF4340 domain-containing protein [Lentisphaerae bacterium]|nr:DUF4340 domain-containing protein [Lentisphaerota bacterium]